MATPRVVPSKALAEIRIDFADDQSWASSQKSDGKPHVFLASQLVLGYVNVVYLDPSHYRPGDRVQVSLKGTFDVESWMATNPCNYNWDRKHNTKQFLHMSKILPIRPRYLDGSTSLPTYHLGYEFQACTQAMLDVRFGSPTSASYEIPSPNHDSVRYTCSWSVPSSSNTRFALPGRLKPDDEGYLEVSIKYLLTAVLLREHGREPIAQISEPVVIFDDSHGIQPPTCIADYPDEYRLFTAAVTRPSSIGRNLVTRLSHRQRPQPPPRLFMRTSEPSPLVFRRSLQHATTLVPIELTFLDVADNDYQNITNNDNVKVTWRLQQLRFSAFDGLQKIPTRKRVQKGTGKVSCKTIQESMNTYTCQVGQWRAIAATTDMLQRDSDTATPSTEELHSNSPSKPSRSHERLPGWTDLESSHGLKSISDNTSLGIDHSHIQQLLSVTQSTRSVSSLPLPSTPPPSPTPPLTPPSTSLDSTHGVDPPQKSTHITQISLPVSIPLSSFKLPTSTTSYMVTRYTLSIQIQMRLNHSTLNTNIGKEHDSTSHRKTSSWIARATLDVPIQLLYADDNDDEKSSSSTRADGTLHNVTNDHELEAIRGLMADLHRRGSQSSEGTERSGSSDATGGPRTISVPQVWRGGEEQEEEEVLPTYVESTSTSTSMSMGHTSMLRPATTSYF